MKCVLIILGIIIASASFTTGSSDVQLRKFIEYIERETELKKNKNQRPTVPSILRLPLSADYDDKSDSPPKNMITRYPNNWSRTVKPTIRSNRFIPYSGSTQMPTVPSILRLPLSADYDDKSDSPPKNMITRYPNNWSRTVKPTTRSNRFIPYSGSTQIPTVPSILRLPLSADYDDKSDSPPKNMITRFPNKWSKTVTPTSRFDRWTSNTMRTTTVAPKYIPVKTTPETTFTEEPTAKMDTRTNRYRLGDWEVREETTQNVPITTTPRTPVTPEYVPAKTTPKTTFTEEPTSKMDTRTNRYRLGDWKSREETTQNVPITTTRITTTPRTPVTPEYVPVKTTPKTTFTDKPISTIYGNVEVKKETTKNVPITTTTTTLRTPVTPEYVPVKTTPKTIFTEKPISTINGTVEVEKETTQNIPITTTLKTPVTQEYVPLKTTPKTTITERPISTINGNVKVKKETTENAPVTTIVPKTPDTPGYISVKTTQKVIITENTTLAPLINRPLITMNPYATENIEEGTENSVEKNKPGDIHPKTTDVGVGVNLNEPSPPKTTSMSGRKIVSTPKTVENIGVTVMPEISPKNSQETTLNISDDARQKAGNKTKILTKDVGIQVDLPIITPTVVKNGSTSISVAGAPNKEKINVSSPTEDKSTNNLLNKNSDDSKAINVVPKNTVVPIIAQTETPDIKITSDSPDGNNALRKNTSDRMTNSPILPEVDNRFGQVSETTEATKMKVDSKITSSVTDSSKDLVQNVPGSGKDANLSIGSKATETTTELPKLGSVAAKKNESAKVVGYEKNNSSSRNSLGMNLPVETMNKVQTGSDIAVKTTIGVTTRNPIVVSEKTGSSALVSDSPKATANGTNSSIETSTMNPLVGNKKRDTSKTINLKTTKTTTEPSAPEIVLTNRSTAENSMKSSGIKSDDQKMEATLSSTNVNGPKIEDVSRNITQTTSSTTEKNGGTVSSEVTSGVSSVAPTEPEKSSLIVENKNLTSLTSTEPENDASIVKNKNPTFLTPTEPKNASPVVRNQNLTSLTPTEPENAPSIVKNRNLPSLTPTEPEKTTLIVKNENSASSPPKTTELASKNGSTIESSTENVPKTNANTLNIDNSIATTMKSAQTTETTEISQTFEPRTKKPTYSRDGLMFETLKKIGPGDIDESSSSGAKTSKSEPKVPEKKESKLKLLLSRPPVYYRNSYDPWDSEKESDTNIDFIRV